MPRDGFYFRSRWSISQQEADFTADGHFRNPFRSCEMGCENAHPLRNPPLAAKLTIYCENKKPSLGILFKRYKFDISFLTGHLNFK